MYPSIHLSIRTIIGLCQFKDRYMIYVFPFFFSSSVFLSRSLFSFKKTKREKGERKKRQLNHQPLNTIFQHLDLLGQLARLICRNTDRNHRSRDTDGSSEGHFTGHVDVVDIFVLTNQW